MQTLTSAIVYCFICVVVFGLLIVGTTMILLWIIQVILDNMRITYRAVWVIHNFDKVKEAMKHDEDFINAEHTDNETTLER